MASFFAQYPEFVEQDSRRVRGFSPVTAESLDVRHECALPSWLVRGNSVLDLGSCLAATGHWALSHGALSYTGVEAQTELVTASREIMARYWTAEQCSIHQGDVREFLRQARAQGRRWDVVVMIGVIYAFLDTYGLLAEVDQVSDYCLVVDSVYPWYLTGPTVAMTQYTRSQHINTAQQGRAYQGAGARPSPAALTIMLETMGWECRESLLYPRPIADQASHDSYCTSLTRPGSKTHYKAPGRYLVRYFKTGAAELATVSERVVKQEIDSQTMMAQNPETEPRSEPWQFDPTVAARFQKEAALHIPDYQRVIEQCQDVVSWLYPHQRDLALVDVGSALGHTMQQFADLGYTNVWGIEASEAMRAQSQMQDRVLLTDQFDTGQQWQVVLANWTLHFVRDRAQYLASIYKAMAPGGTLIISDKMAHGILEETLYHNWKRSQGVSDDEIKEKQQRLVGVLVPMPLSWYLDTLKTLGFEDIAVINSRFMFHTIYARRG